MLLASLMAALQIRSIKLNTIQRPSGPRYLEVAFQTSEFHASLKRIALTVGAASLQPRLFRPGSHEECRHHCEVPGVIAFSEQRTPSDVVLECRDVTAKTVQARQKSVACGTDPWTQFGSELGLGSLTNLELDRTSSLPLLMRDLA